MRTFLKVDSIAQSIGNNFTLSADIGSVSPNSATRQQLLAGLELQVDSNAVSITISEQGGTAQTTQNIDKNSQNCINLNIVATASAVI